VRTFGVWRLAFGAWRMPGTFAWSFSATIASKCAGIEPDYACPLSGAVRQTPNAKRL
jgi:hypothetical protein